MSLDRAALSVQQARAKVDAEGHRNVAFQVADLFDLPFEDETFEHVLLCFVLEQLARPDEALLCLRRVLRPGGSITVIEGDHGSWYCHPQTPEASRVVQCLIEIQARLGGDSMIGRRLYPLLAHAGLQDVHVSPRMVYVDSSRPALVEGFSKNTFIAMVEGVQAQVLSLGLVDERTWEQGIRDLYRATAPDGAFCYTFFKATALR